MANDLATTEEEPQDQTRREGDADCAEGIVADIVLGLPGQILKLVAVFPGGFHGAVRHIAVVLAGLLGEIAILGLGRLGEIGVGRAGGFPQIACGGLEFLAAGWSAIYPCHVPPAQMRRHPIGTGPFKFVDLKSNERARVEKNAGYWKPGRPYLDAIEYTIIASRATRMLSFAAGNSDMLFPTDVTVPLLKDIKKQVPDAQCTLRPLGVTYNLIINRDSAPFNDERVRKALALTLDRQTFVDITSEGKDVIGGSMLPPPTGVWGVGPDALKEFPGYGGDVEANREKGRALMREAGYGPDKRVKIKLSTRNNASYRDMATIMTGELRHIYVDAELDLIDSAVYFNRLYQKNYTLVVNATGSSIDDPDQHFAENYGCGSPRNFNGYCNPAVTSLIAAQSRERNVEKRRALVHDIERKLAEDIARPIISHSVAAACQQAAVRGLTIMVNSIYNGWRFEDVWLDR